MPVPGLLCAGFRPFFLLAAAWAAIAVPVWLAAYVHGYALGGTLPAMFWHGHEMVFGFGLAAVAGFLLTAIPNWTGRLPVRGLPLALLASFWVLGRIAMLVPGAALLDLAFPAALIVVVTRELLAGRHWRNLPMLAALALLFAGNLLFHLGIYAAGLRLGIATLLMLIALVGGRIIPSFTRNWLAKSRPDGALPAPEDKLDRVALLVTLAALVAWVGADLAWPASIAGVALAARLARWRTSAVLREPLLLILHVGYGWLAFGLVLLGLEAPAALHALTVGAIGTMTLAVMTRASLGHTGRPLTADRATRAIFVFISLAAVLRLASPWVGALALSLSGVAWSAAFAVFALHYGRFLIAVDPDQRGLRASP
jgi:uncharacterized protein involved in response to NO